MTIYLRKIHWITFVVLFSFFIACKKQEIASSKVEVKSKTQPNLEKLTSYLSVSFDISREKLKYNEETEEFYVPNTVFKLSLNTVQTAYDSANEYKLNHEK